VFPFLFVLFNWSFIMSQFKAVANSYRAFLKAGGDYCDALREAAKLLKGKPCPELLAELAEVHAAKYECGLSWSGKGAAQFFTGDEYSRDTRHDAARIAWGRYVTVHFKTEPTTSFKTEVDPVAKMIKAMEKLTPAQRRKVLAAFA
jgi:hypothetical protein